MSGLIDRFTDANSERLVEALMGQRLISHDKQLAEAFAKAGQLVELQAGDTLITQGAWDDELYFILVGDFEVIINGRHEANRGPGVHVGELVNLGTASARTATLRASKQSLVLKVSQAKVADIAGSNVDFIRSLATVLKERLDERNAKIGIANEVPRVFVISSSGAKPVVELIEKFLDSDNISVEPWYDGTFGVSEYPVSSLMDKITSCDFTISVVRADDTIVARGKEGKIARDNVHLEYGISLGVLGRIRSILLVSETDDLTLPTDTAGLTTFRYKEGNGEILRKSIRKVCVDIREAIEKEGVFTGQRIH